MAKKKSIPPRAERDKIARAQETLIKTEYEHRVKQRLPNCKVVWPKEGGDGNGETDTNDRAVSKGSRGAW